MNPNVTIAMADDAANLAPLMGALGGVMVLFMIAGLIAFAWSFMRLP